MQTRGFTLIQLLCAIAIVAMTLALGLPNLVNLLHKNQVESVTQSLFDSVQLTRSRAVFGNQRITLRKLEHWEDGWEVFVDSNNNGLRDESEELLQIHERSNSVKIKAAQLLQNYVSYIGTGQSRMVGNANSGFRQSGSFKICPITQGSGFVLILAPSGRMRTETLSAEDCNELN